MQDQKIKSWRQEFWVWVIIGLPLTTILGCLFALVLAFKNADDVVKEDWYKEGLAINANIESLQTAKKMGLSALVQVNNKTGQVRVVLKDTKNKSAKNPILMLSFEHPTHEKYDQTIPLSLNSQGEYVGQLQTFQSGSYYVSLTSTEKPYWKLKGKLQLMQEPQTTLGYS